MEIIMLIILIISWSPEGSHLVTSRGVSGNNHTAVILPRGKWEPPQDFVGHSKPVVSVVNIILLLYYIIPMKMINQYIIEI